MHGTRQNCSAPTGVRVNDGRPGRCRAASGRMEGSRRGGGSAVIGYLAALATGYVLGTKAGRDRYQQIVSTYRAVMSNPATKSVIDAGRRKIADRVSPDPAMVMLTEVDEATTVIGPDKFTSP